MVIWLQLDLNSTVNQRRQKIIKFTNLATQILPRSLQTVIHWFLTRLPLAVWRTLILVKVNILRVLSLSRSLHHSRRSPTRHVWGLGDIIHRPLIVTPVHSWRGSTGHVWSVSVGLVVAVIRRWRDSALDRVDSWASSVVRWHGRVHALSHSVVDVGLILVIGIETGV